jgi:hypothetical protein
MVSKKPFKSPIPRVDSLPLPETIADALTPVRKDEPYVSFRVGGRGADQAEAFESLKQLGHAFYIGKMGTLSIGQRIKRLMGWGKVSEGMYSEEYITSILGYLKSAPELKHIPTIVVGRALSDLFNGLDEDARSVEDTIALIEWIAKWRFGMKVNAIDLELQPQHRELFDELRVDVATGQLDVDAALGQEGQDVMIGEVPPNYLSSYDLACFLYRATQKDERLFHVFSSTRPEFQKREVGDDPTHSSHYYALAEVAIRLTDLLRGIHVQGGVDRQGKYDDIIEGIIKGKKGRYRSFEVLQPLFDIFEHESQFSTLHLVNERSYYTRKPKQIRARTRMGVYAAAAIGLGIAVWDAGYEQGQEDAQTENEALDDYLARELADVHFFWDTNKPMRQENNVSFFKETLLPSLLRELGARYGFSSDQLEDLQLKELLTQHLLKNKRGIRNIPDDYTVRVPMLDSFIEANRAYFLARGVTVDRPYFDFAQYREAFDNTEALGDRVIDVNTNEAGSDVEWTLIGNFIPTRRFGLGVYDLYVVTHEGTPYLMARNVAKEPYDLETRKSEYFIFSTAKGQEEVESFRQSMRHYDLAQLKDFQYEFPSRVLEADEDYEASVVDAKYSEHLPDYTDYYDGRFDYQFIRYRAWNKEKDVSVTVLMARDMKRGDEKFSTQTAREAYDYFCETWAYCPGSR